MDIRPIFFARESLLTRSGVTLGLPHLLLALVTIIMTVASVMKNGILINLGMGFNPFTFSLLYLHLALIIPLLAAYVIEKLASKNLIGATITVIASTINIFGVFLTPVYVLSAFQYIHAVEGFIMVGSYTIILLKLTSYGDINNRLRKLYFNPPAPPPVLRRSRRLRKLPPLDSELAPATAPAPTGQVYPNNVTIKDLCYFVMTPTLCYDLNFPRSDRIRVGRVASLVLQLVVLVQLAFFLQQQLINPFISETLEHVQVLRVLDLQTMLETRIPTILAALQSFVQLVVANNLCWLMFFYSFFHLGLNILAEVTQFADRDFYTDWWHAETIVDFWRRWNMPVHKWAVRHVYVDLKHKKEFGNIIAGLSVFFLSAIFHEYLISIPLRIFSLHAFYGMMAQCPLAIATYFISGRIGHIIVWLSIMIGQPMGIILYALDVIDA